MSAYNSERINAMLWSKSLVPEPLQRDPCANYFEGYCSITLTVREKAPVLGYIEGRADAEEGAPDYPAVRCTEVGEGVMRCWQQIPQFHPNVTLIEAQVMPDHFHGLLRMSFVPRKHLGAVIRGFMTGCTHAYWDALGIPWREMKSADAPQGKADRRYVDRSHSRSYRGPSLFVRGYNDVEPLTQAQIDTKIAYIRSNPQRRLIKGMLHDRFSISRHQKNHQWVPETIRIALQSDRWFGQHPTELQQAWEKILPRLNDGLDVVGNRDLLRYRMLPLVCHRADVGRFEEQRQQVMAAARSGYIIVSSFISPREREIMKQLAQESLPYIEIMDNGFSRRYKPSGKAFYACAENRLLQLTPWTHLYDRHGTTVTREMCLIMNHLALTITHQPDDWWKSRPFGISTQGLNLI